MYIKVILLYICLMLASCGGLQRTDIGDGSQATVNQQQDSASGAKVQAERIDDINTKNIEGVHIAWFIGGALLFGMVIPQPRIVRLLW